MAIINEDTGCALLHQRFTAAGLAIIEHFPFEAEGISIRLDGFDPAARVGYEYITTEAGDRAELTGAVIEGLERLMAEGGLYVLLVDELEVDGPETLERAADRFLERVLAQGSRA